MTGQRPNADAQSNGQLVDDVSRLPGSSSTPSSGGSPSQSEAALDAEAAPPRPAKRRKLDGQAGTGVSYQDDYWANAIPVARVAVAVTVQPGSDANAPDSGSRGQEHDSAFAANDSPVSVMDLREDEADQLSCKITLQGTPGVTLSIQKSAPAKDLELFKQCVSLQIKNKNAAWKPVFKLAWPRSRGPAACFLEVCLLWRNAKSVAEARSDKRNDLLAALTTAPASSDDTGWTPRDFYDNVHVPRTDDEDSNTLSIDGLDCQLYSFQKRAIKWLLRREGVDRTADKLVPFNAKLDLPLGFTACKDADGREFYVSPWLGIATTNQALLSPFGDDLRGGILAEEMGLGKTVEVISLILSHRRKDQPRPEGSPGSLRDCGATLIVAPISILQQWENEIRMRAPELKVMIYKGVKATTKKTSGEEMIDRLLSQDVVLVTYPVLSREIHFAAEVPDRNFRQAKQYERKTSPLVKLHWWRVVLDECQMVESGVNQAARVVNQIPRRNAWAVSGTPVKKDANDLFGLLTFLRLAPYCWSTKLWRGLIEDYRDVSRQLFRKIALRHSKEQVKKDIQLPPQKRIVITVPFTQIEEQYYSNLFQQMCDECGLDLKGAPLREDWDPNDPVVVERMRSWLVRLRQVCLHPEVGGRNRRALGGEGPLRTVAEVLQVMIDQNEASTRAEERNLHITQLKWGQRLEHAKKPQEALVIWQNVYKQAHQAVQECRKQYEQALEVAWSSSPEKEEDAADARIGAVRNRLRSALEVEHMCTFFIASAYYQIKTDENQTEPGSDRFKELEKLETETYEKAKVMRTEMLTETQSKADTFMTKIDAKAKNESFVTIPNFKDLSVHGGIESHDVIRRIHRLFDTLNLQAEALDEMREELTKLLLIPLVDRENDELQGDEYEASTKQQDKVYVYMEGVRAMVSDRRDALTGLENYLIKEDSKTSLKNAEKGEGHAPELMVPILRKRLELKPSKNLGSFRTIVAELRALKTALKSQADRNSRAAAEMEIVNKALNRMQEEATRHGKVNIELENEAGLYRDAMNARLDYYRQLQKISDTVAPLEEDIPEQDLEQARLMSTEAASAKRLDSLRSRGRYLFHLQDNSSAVNVERMCLICQEKNFEIGTLTSCGHAFCKECLNLWWSRHRSCPACKKHLKSADLHQITYKPSELTLQEEPGVPPSSSQSGSSQSGSSPRSDSSGNTSIYSGINQTTLAQIQNIDVSGSFGTKIDTLARHVLWLRAHDPGAKAILFSQFRDFLAVLERAFARAGIRSTGIEAPGGVAKFQHDPAVECFFLHARAHASGLNLVHATHVFLCEPLLNTALELQALARVHRIGQHRPTTVWMYLVEGTVEKAVYDISVRRRLTLLAKGGKEAGARPAGERLDDDIEKANSLQLREAPLARLVASGKSGGGEVVGKEDLWDCLFSAGPARGSGVAAPVGSGDGGGANGAAAAFLAGEAAERRLVERGRLAMAT